MSLCQQSDGNLVANVRVSSVQDAQYVISQLHRRKIGHKRILISNAQTSTTNPHVIRSQIIALLQVFIVIIVSVFLCFEGIFNNDDNRRPI